MSLGKKIKIAILDEKTLRLEGVKSLLGMESDIEVVNSGESPRELLTLLKITKPEVLVVLGRYYSEALEASNGMEIRVVVITSPKNVFLNQMINSKVMGITLDTSGRRELLSAIRCASRNIKYIDPNIMDDWEEHSRLRTLSARELEIFHKIAQGMDNFFIAENMHISERTVKNHVSRILKKLELHNRTQIAVFAWSNGIARIMPESLGLMLKSKLKSKRTKASL